ncbi:daunorubicin/doxorubicin resistance ABC transporter ATP-binding protein DrrA [Streptomyces pharetrae CZA14]|uniref:Daunorubicin/doxorubicin resistance ABC transporter ATP-binding protein DrrA n=1 Tax=Streptomyces pharetrae CZA14 TaxID=1144883 RepID=A0ABX3YPT2_9ACTN|nr:daunorubicin/doxorubicin resistance ABC transporter ATP-binding protein DrrA [Streptomyces pharetrae CZA14]
MTSSKPAVAAEGLRKGYGTAQVLDGLDLVVPQGTVCGLLGPNGAGKTTTVGILSTLLSPDRGRAEVAGFDVTRQAAQVRHRIGLVGQHAAVDEVLSGRQNLVMFGRLHHLSPALARHRADELLEHFRLTDTGGKPVKDYSGGMRRRLDLAASMVLAPPVLFLDEPTTGLDPRSRNEVWDAVRALVGGGTTVLLTTQYLEEADQLADSISVIDTGKVIAEGTPEQLKARIGGDRIDIVARRADELGNAAAAVARIGAADPVVDEDTRQVSVQVRDRATALTDIVRALDLAGITAQDIALRRPTLDEVFLHLTATERFAPAPADAGHKPKPEVVKA